jgi:DNA-binding phage protein
VSESDAIKGIRRAARQRERADQSRAQAIADLLRFIRQAQADGESISRIAREARLSRQGIYDLLAARPS